MNAQLSIDEAIASVYQNTSVHWKDKANAAVFYLCRNRETFTADDVLEMVKDEPCHDLRALGAVMRNAQAEGLCRSTGRYVQSRLPQRHKRPVVIWESTPGA